MSNEVQVTTLKPPGNYNGTLDQFQIDEEQSRHEKDSVPKDSSIQDAKVSTSKLSQVSKPAEQIALTNSQIMEQIHFDQRPGIKTHKQSITGQQEFEVSQKRNSIQTDAFLIRESPLQMVESPSSQFKA